MINRNYSQIKTNVGENIQDTSTAMASKIARYVNDIYFDILRRINFEIYDEDYSFTTSSQDNVLPFNFGKALKVWDSTNKREISFSSIEQEVENNLETIDQTGTVDRYVILNRPVQTQPSSETTIDIVSSSASDTMETIYIRGVSSGVELTETATLNGTSTVTTTNSYSKIITLTKSTTTLGKVTITSGSDTLAVMPPEAIDYKVQILRLYQAPSSSITLNVPYIIKPLPLSADGDVPLLDIADIIEDGATARSWKYKRQFTKAREHTLTYEKMIADLIFDRENDPNKVHTFNYKPYPRNDY